MRNPANLIALALIALLTAVAVVIVWPSDPDRYLETVDRFIQNEAEE